MSEIQTRFLKQIGTRAFLRVYWGDDCPNCFGSETRGCHDAQVFLAESLTDDDNLGGIADDYPDDRWPTFCNHCGVAVPPMPAKILCDCGCGELRYPKEAPQRQVNRRVLYEAQDGSRAVRTELQPGDMYWATWFNCKESGHCIHGWTNCDGKHLIVIVPRNHPWDTNGRASNCGSPDDTLHRCWVVHGNPELGEPVTVDKSGLTCGAGGGSILAGSYHGVLSGGVLRGDDTPAVTPAPSVAPVVLPEPSADRPSDLPARDPACQAQSRHYSNCNCVDRSPF